MKESKLCRVIVTVELNQLGGYTFSAIVEGNQTPDLPSIHATYSFADIVFKSNWEIALEHAFVQIRDAVKREAEGGWEHSCLFPFMSRYIEEGELPEDSLEKESK